MNKPITATELFTVIILDFQLDKLVMKCELYLDIYSVNTFRQKNHDLSRGRRNKNQDTV